jgi:hypothetical protein
MRRAWLSGWVLAAVLALPGAAVAKESEEPYSGNPSILSYGFDGLIDGAVLGLAAGYLSTGTHYQKGEWRKLIIGTGVGAIAGLGAGITLAVVDDSAPGPGLGSYVLRDIGYGTMLGALSGAVIGALFFVGSDHPKDILVGTAVGSLVGAGVGVALGVIEGSNARRRYARRDRTNATSVRFSVAAATTVQGAPVLMPVLRGVF